MEALIALLLFAASAFGIAVWEHKRANKTKAERDAAERQNEASQAIDKKIQDQTRSPADERIARRKRLRDRYSRDDTS